jgi:hypothetical protein
MADNREESYVESDNESENGHVDTARRTLNVPTRTSIWGVTPESTSPVKLKPQL